MQSTDPIEQLEDENNLKKYVKAGEILSNVLDKLVEAAKPGIEVYDLCIMGDRLINEESQNSYPEIAFKGICFPTCISKNNIAGNFSPIAKGEKILEGDLLKIELGCAIDGFPAQIGYTLIVKEDDKTVINPKIVNVMMATSEASKKIFKMMKPGTTNFQIREILELYAKRYDCRLPYTENDTLAPGLISYQMSKNIIDGFNDEEDEFAHKIIISKENTNYPFKMIKSEFEENEVYCIDVMFTSGTGKMNKSDAETTIFRRLNENFYPLKLKASKDCLSKFGKGSNFPINVREYVNNSSSFRFGLKDCLNKDLIEEYPVYQEKKGEYIARTKFTVIVRSEPILITGRSAEEQLEKL